MSRETHFKEGAWIGGYEFTDERTLKEDIAMKIWGDDGEMLAIAKQVVNEQRNRDESESNQDR